MRLYPTGCVSNLRDTLGISYGKCSEKLALGRIRLAWPKRRGCSHWLDAAFVLYSEKLGQRYRKTGSQFILSTNIFNVDWKLKV